MSRNKAIRTARVLLKKYHLDNWTVGFYKSKKYFALCRHEQKRISFSLPLVTINNHRVFKLVVKHEIAHALIGFGHEHKDVWKAKVLEIGGTSELSYKKVGIKYAK